MTVPSELIHHLQQRLGSDRVDTSPVTLTCYSYDATNLPRMPEAVVFARTEQEVADILALCYRFEVPITPRGAGVGFSGGSVPCQGGIVLVLTGMNRILEIDRENLVARVEPGVITAALQAEAARWGLFYPPDPASVKSSTIGGNVAECAGGLSAVKYGVTKHYVLGMRFVLPDGTVCAYGGKTVKNVVGYDLASLLVGSEGTLAVMTEFTLKLLPRPEARRTLLVSFASLEDAGRSVAGIIRSRIIPRAMELMDRESIRAVDRIMHYGFPDGTEALLLLELDGGEIELDAVSVKLTQTIEEYNGNILKTATNDSDSEQLWDVRRSISPCIATLRNTKINEDIVVPRNAVPDIIREVQDIAARYGLIIICFGHAGDGNIHVNLMVDRDDKEEMGRARSAVDDIFSATLALGGGISGEHGIGLAKKDYIARNLSPETIELSKRLKQAFDPKGLLNPGKIFP